MRGNPELMRIEGTEPLRLIFKACKELKDLAISSDPSPKDSDVSTLIHVLLGLCQEHLQTLERFSITDSSPLSFESGIRFAGTLLLHGPSDASMLQLRHAERVQHLTIDASLLLVLRPASSNDADTNPRSPPITIPQFPNRQFRSHIDLDLPRSLISLELRVSDEAELQTVMLSALAAWCRGIQIRFSALQRLIVAWEESDSVTVNRTMCSQEVAEELRLQGVVLVQTSL